MAWFLNHYRCGDCGEKWSDEWSCCCDDECDRCGSRDWSPYRSDDLTEVIEQQGDQFAVLLSPENAEHRPNYRTVARFPTQAAAQKFVSDGEMT